MVNMRQLLDFDLPPQWRAYTLFKVIFVLARSVFKQSRRPY
jgi:hypothetical protein